MSHPILFTLCEKDYHYGVAAWVNSAIAQGYAGPVCVFHRGAPPPWAASLERVGEGRYRVGPVEIAFHQVDPPRHLGYHKPFFALEALRLYPECDAALYCDPDVVFIAPWAFFDDWISRGIAVCLDSHFPLLPEDHPWRTEWRRMLEKAGLPAYPGAPYVNGGFFSIPRSEARFLEIATALTEVYEAEGNDTSRYYMEERHRAVVGCPDILAAALMGWNGPRTVLGPEGMGFTGYHFLLSHDIDSPKAWRSPVIRRALDGRPPSRAAGLYLEYANAPIAPYTAAALARKKAAYRLAQLITRVWRR